MFRMLKLNPPHGWAAVFWELGIVTVGVLIALAAQQWAEGRAWKQRVVDADRQLRSENEGNFFYAAERVVVSPCIDAQADRLLAILNSPATRIPPQPPRTSALGTFPIRAPSRPFSTTAWEGIVSDGVAARFEEDRRAVITSAYTQINDLNPMGDAEAELKSGLTPMLFPLPLGDELRGQLIERVMKLKNNNALMALEATQIMTSLIAVSVTPSRTSVDDGLRRSTTSTAAFCRSQGLPVGDWYAALREDVRVSIKDSDAIARQLQHQQQRR